MSLFDEPPIDGPAVLVVDDNPTTRYSTSRVLKAAGFQIQEAGTGTEAIELADAGISAVILDVHLPDLDGFEVCRCLRSRQGTLQLPVIHLSAAYVSDDDKVRGLDCGADAYMTHPVEPALLVATVRTLMRMRAVEDGMRRSEARFRAIYKQALNGICLFDTAGCFIEANPAMLDLLKRSQSEVVGRRLVDFAPSCWVERIDAYLADSRTGMWFGEFPLLDSNAGLVHLEWSWSAHLEPGVSMAIATNISERIALSHQRDQLLEREQAARAAAERISRSKDEFVAILSHELRTPLNAILSWVHVLKQDPAQHLTRGLEAIERNAKTQTRLISDILDVSRMDLGKLSLDLEMVNVGDLVNSAVSALGGSIRDKALRVEVETNEVSRPMVADPARLQQIVWNLLTNAIKFCQSGGQIHIGLRQDDSNLTLTVSDDGQGIKPDFLPFLFDRFTQSDYASNRYHGGLGLGLSIVKQLVELHGGTVSALSSGPGQGAAFIAVFPIKTDAPQPCRSTKDADGGDAQLATSLAGLNIVVVEDDAETREMLCLILRDRDARVRSACNFAKGLHCLEQQRPDLLISDIGLPGQDGYALIREVRQRERGGLRLPAIALTAFARAEDKQLALTAGFDSYLAKPLRPNDLIATIFELAHPAMPRK
ncbi:response regulator [Chitinimonas arctica]|uniref:histidine kinase n=1 Tax=Chitinimonas arctica TaxID=2594795 RepID=A0A516SBP4_9NEIS|nr:response regulator [Chitinimonas arctica]QDQ25575.1 response regulator [Chitinimonas arctica]